MGTTIDNSLEIDYNDCIAPMVESVVTGDLKSPAFGRAGSSPARGTIFKHIGVWRTLLKTSEGRTLYSVFEYGKVRNLSLNGRRVTDPKTLQGTL